MKSILPFVGILLASSSAQAYDRFSREQAVLEHFGVPEEPPTQPVANTLHAKQTLAGFLKILKYGDSVGEFARFANWNQSGVQVYQDVDAKQVEDFQIRFAASDEEVKQEPEDFELRIQAARSNPEGQELRGLRVALDPGHMGGSVWDHRTGKYASDGHGHIVSEGLINLQVTLLLEQRLKALGADVMITHRELGPVSELPYESYDLKPWALISLMESALDPWFTKLLGTAPAGGELYSAFTHDRDFQRNFSESQRSTYFILGADLQARVEKIDDFHPDIVLIIHFDTGDRSGTDQPTVALQGFNATKTFVTGGYEAGEFVSRRDRIGFARHFLSASSWNSSLQLSRRVVASLHSHLGLPLENNGSSANTREVEPGIFARKLYIPARMTAPAAVSYAECLFYDNAEEFRRLLRADHSMEIGGVSTTYSDRLIDVADGFKDAVVNFVRSAP
ncbi:MAG: hypothetical protein ACXVCH_02325 [Bdellovibrionota bacterium]